MHKINKKWNAQIQINGNKINIGYFQDEIDAAKAYDIKAKELFGEFACLNEIEISTALKKGEKHEEVSALQ